MRIVLSVEPETRYLDVHLEARVRHDLVLQPTSTTTSDELTAIGTRIRERLRRIHGVDGVFWGPHTVRIVRGYAFKGETVLEAALPAIVSALLDRELPDPFDAPGEDIALGWIRSGAHYEEPRYGPYNRTTVTTMLSILFDPR